MKGSPKDIDAWLARQKASLRSPGRGRSEAGQGSRAALTLASMVDAVIRTDSAGQIEYWNPAAERLLDLSARSARGKTLREVLSLLGETSRTPIDDPVTRCLSQRQALEAEGEASLIIGGDKEIPVRYSVGPLAEEDGKVSGAVMVLRDVSHLRQRERQMKYLASHDPLTGLINRRQFESFLDEVVAEAQKGDHRHMVFYLDLDQFKGINDSCGHLAGDEMLKQVTSLLSSKVRASDVLARLGGDEFGVVLRDCPFDKALEIADSMREGVKSYRFTWEERVFQIGVSIGVVPVGKGVSREQVLRAADAACYVAKEKGRNRIQISQADDVEVASQFGEMQWIHRLQQALQENRFRPYFQALRPLGSPPGSDRLVGEVLLRMEDPEGELIPPATFLPAAERYRLTAALDRWVLKAVARLLARHGWSTGGRLAINLSPQFVADSGCVDFILKVAQSHGIPAEWLAFEISETAAVANMATAQRVIARLRRAGFWVGLDDFGSGFSSFGYLSGLRVDYLKVTGELVKGAENDPVQRTLVQSIHQIGHVLEVQTVGKSVETPVLEDLLVELGLDYGQGYWIAGVEPLEDHLAAAGGVASPSQKVAAEEG